jgi:hypothetical protein
MCPSRGRSIATAQHATVYFVVALGAGGRFSPSTSVSPDNLHSTNFSTITITVTRGWYNRPVVAAVPKKSHPTNLKKNLIHSWKESRYSDGLGTGRLEFDSLQGHKLFLCFVVSRPSLGLTQLPIKWVPRALSLGVKRPAREAGYLPLSSAEIKNGGAIPPLPDTCSRRDNFISCLYHSRKSNANFRRGTLTLLSAATKGSVTVR